MSVNKTNNSIQNKGILEKAFGGNKKDMQKLEDYINKTKKEIKSNTPKEKIKNDKSKGIII